MIGGSKAAVVVVIVVEMLKFILSDHYHCERDGGDGRK